MTSECANCRSPLPRTYWKSSCDATNGPAHYSPQIVPWTTGESCWVIPPRSARCSTGFSTMATFSSAARGVGAPKRFQRAPHEQTIRLRSKELKSPLPVCPSGEAGAGSPPPRHVPSPANNAGTPRAAAPPTRGHAPCASPLGQLPFQSPFVLRNSTSLLPKRSRQGKTMTCPDCVSHWPVLG
jgi:hypothetical protein